MMKRPCVFFNDIILKSSDRHTTSMDPRLYIPLSHPAVVVLYAVLGQLGLWVSQTRTYIVVCCVILNILCAVILLFRHERQHKLRCAVVANVVASAIVVMCLGRYPDNAGLEKQSYMLIIYESTQAMISPISLVLILWLMPDSCD